MHDKALGRKRDAANLLLLLRHTWLITSGCSGGAILVTANDDNDFPLFRGYMVTRVAVLSFTSIVFSYDI